MGGGGGSDRSSLGDTRQLEDRAKEILQQGDSSRTNVFLSFAYEDLDAVNLLRGQAKNEKSDLEFNDLSVKEPIDSQRADYIKLKINERLSRCSTVVVYLSNDTARSDWVRWEVEKSLELGKRIIAAHSGEVAPQPMPSFIEKNRIKVVRWSKLAKELVSR
jgi:hypothetical protein